MQNFGGTNKEYYGIFESGLLEGDTCAIFVRKIHDFVDNGFLV